jgi:hypothetical protein
VTRFLSKNTASCVGWTATLDHLLKLAPQIHDITSLGRHLATLNYSLLVDLRCLLTHDLHLVVSTAVVVPYFTPGNRISDRKIQGFLLRPGKNIRKLDRKHKPVKSTVWEGLLIAGGDFRYRLPLVKGEAHGNPFFEREIAHANDTFNRGPNQVDVLDDNITRIFGQ